MNSANERFLVIDTAHRHGHVAVALGDHIVGRRPLEEARRHARDLAPLVKELLGEQGWRPRDLAAVMVSRGPGSYTGLRVGLMSAKTLAYATGGVLLGVDTFAAIARQLPDPTIDVIADAQQGKVYCQRFIAGMAEPLSIKTLAEWLATLPPDAVVTGPALEIHGKTLPPTIRQADAGAWLPSPESLLALGLERWARGEGDDPFTLEPLYLRPSSAEEMHARK